MKRAAGQGDKAQAGGAASLWFPFVLLILLQVLFLARDGWGPLRGELFDPDAYARLNRVQVLYDTGDWYSTVIPRSNAPHGERLHWTRPLDMLLLAGAAPLWPFIGFRQALHWSGVFIGPLLHALALAALLWAARPLMARRDLVYVGVLSLCQPAFLYYFLPGRPDHHSLLLLLFVIMLGLGLRLSTGPFRAWTSLAAGGAAAASVWVSVEGLVGVAPLLGGLGLLWIALRADFALKNLVVCAGLTAGTLVALAIELPLDALATAAYERISVVHLFVFALLAGFWLAVWGLERRGGLCATPGRRLALALVGAGAVAGLTWLAYPKFFAGPAVAFDPRAVSLWIAYISEVAAFFQADDPVASLRPIALFLGPAALALPFLAVLLRRGGGAAPGWAYLALFLALFLPLAVFAARGIRWSAYAEILLVVPYAALLAQVLGGLERRAVGAVARGLGRAALVVAFGVGFLFLEIVLSRLDPAVAEGEGFAECRVRAVAEYLERAPEFGPGPKRILAFVFIGPELLYRGRHEVVASSYPLDPAGLFDVTDFFTASDETAARAIVERRGADLVLICPGGKEAALYLARRPGPTMLRRLAGDDAPAWLREVPLPGAAGEDYRLFAVED